MKTNNELLILGIKARQKQLSSEFNELFNSISIDNTLNMNDLINKHKEYQQLESMLSQIDPTYNVIPF